MFFAGKAGKTRVEKSLAGPVNVGKRYAWDATISELKKQMKAAASSLEMAYELKTALKQGNQEAIRKHADVFFNLTPIFAVCLTVIRI
jgi:hypothetical protein